MEFSLTIRRTMRIVKREGKKCSETENMNSNGNILNVQQQS